MKDDITNLQNHPMYNRGQFLHNPQLLNNFFQQGVGLNPYGLNIVPQDDLKKVIPKINNDKKREKSSSSSKNSKNSGTNRKKFFDLKRLSNYDKLDFEKNNLKEKDEKINLNDINMIDDTKEIKNKRKLSDSSSSENNIKSVTSKSKSISRGKSRSISSSKEESLLSIEYDKYYSSGQEKNYDYNQYSTKKRERSISRSPSEDYNRKGENNYHRSYTKKYNRNYPNDNNKNNIKSNYNKNPRYRDEGFFNDKLPYASGLLNKKKNYFNSEVESKFSDNSNENRYNENKRTIERKNANKNTNNRINKTKFGREFDVYPHISPDNNQNYKLNNRYGKYDFHNGEKPERDYYSKTDDYNRRSSSNKEIVVIKNNNIHDQKPFDHSKNNSGQTLSNPDIDDSNKNICSNLITKEEIVHPPAPLKRIRSNFSDNPPEEIKYIEPPVSSINKFSFVKDNYISTNQNIKVKEINILEDNPSFESKNELKSNVIISTQFTNLNKNKNITLSYKSNQKHYNSWNNDTHNNANLKIINVSGKKKIFLNKERKNPDVIVVKRDK